MIKYTFKVSLGFSLCPQPSPASLHRLLLANISAWAVSGRQMGFRVAPNARLFCPQLSWLFDTHGQIPCWQSPASLSFLILMDSVARLSDPVLPVSWV